MARVSVVDRTLVDRTVVRVNCARDGVRELKCAAFAAVCASMDDCFGALRRRLRRRAAFCRTARGSADG
jgi:hypothetical protein